MKIVESFKTKTIKPEKLNTELDNITMLISKNTSPDFMKILVKDYINYISSKSNISFNVNIFEDEVKQNEFGNFLIQPQKLVETDFEKNTLNINQTLFEINTAGEFLNSVNHIGQALQHLKIYQIANYYSSDNSNGIRGEYSNYVNEIENIKNFMERNESFKVGDKKLFDTRAKALQTIDDEEIMARQRGITCVFEILDNMEKNNVSKMCLNAPIDAIKYNINKKEVDTFNSYIKIINETNEIYNDLANKITQTAINENENDILNSMSKLMDTKLFFSYECYNILKKYAKQSDNLKIKTSLENSKYEETNFVEKPKQKRVFQEEKIEHKTPEQVTANFKLENDIKPKYNRYGERIIEEIHEKNELGNQVDFEITSPYEKEEIKINLNKQKPKKQNNNFEVLEETKEGNTTTTIYKEKEPDFSILGMSDEAAQFVKKQRTKKPVTKEDDFEQ